MSATVSAAGYSLLDDARRRAMLRTRLMAWYRKAARDLPWRKTRDPYAVWVSEVMLQQTQVATVVGYFTRFMAAFPTVKHLARADEQQVLRLWEGLGYYRRARQLHRAAQVIVEEHGGEFPRDVEQVRRLPGIGRYSAGAILSIAHDERLPILEANTYRLLARLLEYPGDPQSTAGQKLLWHAAETLLPRRDVGLFNQALMELGALVCTPRAPDCEHCPLALLCPTRASGQQSEIPPPRAKMKFEDRHEAAVLVRRRGKVLLVRVESGRWAGLWDFPRLTLDRGHVERQLVDGVARMTGATVELGEKLTTLKHGVTRFRITLDAFAAEVVSTSKKKPSLETRWVSPKELADYPLSTTGRKLCKYVR